MGHSWLPPEIWRDIFDIATFVSGEFDVHEWIHDKFISGSNSPTSEVVSLEFARLSIASSRSNKFLLLQRDDFQEQQKLRLSMALVCKQWNQMAIEHLYGSVLICSGSSVSTLLRNFRKKPDLGKLVKRLEIKIGSDRTGPLNTHLDRISDIFEFCPNLTLFYGEIIEDEPSSMDPSEVLLRLRGRLAHYCPLVRLAIGHQMLDGFQPTGFFRYLSSSTNLIALELPPRIATMAAPHKPPISLPHLRLLDIGNQAPLISIEFVWYLSRWDLPSLETVHIGTITHQVPLYQFWLTHGKKLKTIRVYNALRTTMGRRLNEINLGVTAPCNVLFPNLRQLIILQNTPSNLLALFIPTSSLELYEVQMHDVPRPTASTNSDSQAHVHIEHQLMHAQLEHQLMGYLLKSHGTACPKLLKIRLSNFPTTKDLKEGDQLDQSLNDKFAKWKAEFEKVGVVLEKIERDA
ncbi:hypothetical protein CPB86DRAFT_778797 [Serendipita vermifera]|nr:hypothetical protein CPB86DRAFT_778797 [Serendipita vermifera]